MEVKLVGILSMKPFNSSEAKTAARCLLKPSLLPIVIQAINQLLRNTPIDPQQMYH